MRHSLIGRPFATTARRVACTAGSMTLTAALLLGAAPTAQAAALATAPAGSFGAVTVAPVDLAADTFARTVTGGWGTATTGGAWTASAGSATYAVANGAGTHRVPTGVTSAVFLNDVEGTDTDTRVDVAFDRKAGSGLAAYASVLGRSVKGASDYRARLVVNWAGTLELQVARGATILAKTPLTDVLYGTNVRTTVRIQVSGTSPTTVRAKAWRTGTEEPAGWQLTTTDADAAMQAPGRLGLSTYASGGTVVASYSDLHVTPTVLPNVLPTASFTAQADDLAVALDASASSDPDGTVAGYAWDHGDGTTSTGRTASHAYASAGTYPVTLTVTDSRGGTATTTRTVTVIAPNVDPLARFTATVDDLAVVLDASASSDSDGTLASLTWDHGDGTTSTGTSSTHLYAAPGTYAVTLTVTDDRGGRSTTTRTVTAIAPNELPTAGFTADVEDLELSVDASSSSDRDGTLESYRWTFGDGTGSTSRTATHTYAVPGDYPVTLTVTDDRGGESTTTRTVTAIAPNVLPTARFAPVADDLTITLDGSASTDADGTLRTLVWDFGDGAVLTGATARHTYAAPGTYPVTLTVTDDRGGIGTLTQTVTAVAPNVLPTARLTAAASDLAVELDASGSADLDGSITSVRWDHGDGTSSTGTTARHTYAAAGDYTVRVTVTDDRGGSATADRVVTVLAPNVAPVAALTAEAADLRVALDGTSSSDADGSVASYAWDFGDGSTGSGATTAYTYPAAGTYTVTLTVTDDRGGSAVATRTVTAVAPRVAALHPFASSSVWNTGIGSEARLEAKTDLRTANLLTATPTINRTQWSIPVFQAKSTDVLGTLYSVRDKKTFTFRVPADATGAAGSGGMADGHGTIIQPDGLTSYDTYKLVKTGPTTWEAQSTRVTDLRGTGIGAGVRAAGVPALAGLVRAHELRDKRIDHALAVAVPNTVLKSGFVFPAKSQDSDGAAAYTGQVPMGSLIALPRTIDIAKLPLSPEGQALARALQNYGGYVVDRAGTAALYCEVACDGTATTRMANDWKVLFKEMRVVTNSSAASIGGGGTPFVAPLGSVG